MTTYSEIGIDQIKPIIDKITGIFDVKNNDSSISFKYKDKDQDSMVIVVTEIDDERLLGFMAMKIPSNLYIASLVAVNNWNQNKDSHGTFGYVTVIDDEPYTIIESHLMLRGGSDEENIKFWVKNLINHINPFEEEVVSAIQNVGEDSNLLKDNNENGFLSGLGTLIGSAVDTWLRTP